MANQIEPLRCQPFYCEENIWQLCQHPLYTGGSVVFIASRGDYFPMLYQQGGEAPDYPVLWDYHVVLLLNGQILDFNSTLHFCSPVQTYFEQSFVDEGLLDPLETPLFRVLSADEYVRTFRSDRSHMKTGEDWHAPPPDWPLICESESNLQRFRDMKDFEFGEVFSADEILNNYRETD